jgi:hypothetical protein
MFISGVVLAITPCPSSCEKFNSIQYSPMAPDDPIVQEQNGKLLFPMLDPETGKYTFDVEKGKQIIRNKN